MSNKKFQGTVVSEKMNKTIVVVVNRIRMHPLYKKDIRLAKDIKFMILKEKPKLMIKLFLKNAGLYLKTNAGD